jgi:pimeloyl-ACP methyl ester carboxylesterase
MFARVLRSVPLAAGFAASLAVIGALHCAAAENTLRIPEPQNITLETADGVVLACSYYKGGFVQNLKTKEVTAMSGKEVVPVIMLHGWNGKRTEYDFTARLLQQFGHAVVVPDLRGHGESLTQKVGGRPVTYNRDRMGRAGVESMIYDIEAVRKFLLEKNDAQELNLEMLCVVGADFGAALAINWASVDWSRQQLPAFKQGNDVKAIVLLSPVQSFKGVTVTQALQHPVVSRSLGVLIVHGQEDTKNAKDAKAIYDRLAKFRVDPGANAKDRNARRDLLLLEPPTSLSGTQLLTPRGLTVNQDLIGYIHGRLTSKKGDYPWTARKHPLTAPDR